MRGSWRKRAFTLLLLCFLVFSFFSFLRLEVWQIKPVMATQYFEDSFEIGWTPWTSHTGMTLTTSQAHTGVYSCQSGTVSTDYVSKTTEDGSQICVRWYFLFNGTDTDGMWLYRGMNSGTSQAYITVHINKVYTDNWYVYPYLNALNSSEQWELYGPYTGYGNLTQGSWYEFEVEWTKNTLNGCTLYVNDTQALQMTGTSANYDVDDHRFGAGDIGTGFSGFWDTVEIASSHIGFASTQTEGEGEADASWTYRVSQNDTSAYIINSSGIVIYSNADPVTVMNQAIKYCDGNGSGSIYVYPDLYLTGEALGGDPLYNYEYSDVYLQLGAGTIIQRTSGSGAEDYMFSLHNYASVDGKQSQNFTLTCNGTAYFHALTYASGFDIFNSYNFTMKNVYFDHLNGCGGKLTKCRYPYLENVTIYDAAVNYTSFISDMNQVQYGNFSNLYFDAVSKTTCTEGLYLGSGDYLDISHGWDGSYFNDFSNCTIKNMRRNGVYLCGSYNGTVQGVSNNTFNNCTLEGNAQDGYFGIKLRPAQNNTFTNIIINNMTGGVTTGTNYNYDPYKGNCTGNYVQAVMSNISTQTFTVTADGDDQEVSDNFFNLTVSDSKKAWFFSDTNSMIQNNIFYVNMTNCTEGLYLQNGNFSDNTFYLNFTNCGGSTDIYHYSGWTNIIDNTFYVYATDRPSELMDFANGTQGNIVYYPYVSGGVGVVINSPINITYSSSSILVTLYATGGIIDKIWFNCKNGSAWIYPENTTYFGSAPMTGFVNGTSYTFYAFANNTLGTEGYSTVMFTVAIGVTDYYYFNWNFKDLDLFSVEDLITWQLYNSSQLLTYTEGQATLLVGTYTLKTFFQSSLKDQQDFLTAADGNTTINVYLQMKQWSYGYLAFNSTLSYLALNAENMYNLTFTIWNMQSVGMTIGYPQSPSYISKDGANQTGWTYAGGYITLSAESSALAVWQIIYVPPPETPTEPVTPPVLPVAPVTVTWTLYMRSDTHTVDNQLGYVLWYNPSFTYTYVSLASSGTATSYWGWRFYIVFKDNSTQEITDGTPVAQVSRTIDGSGIQTGTYTPDTTIFALLHMTVALKADLYIWFGSDTPTIEARFISSNFQARALTNTTWTVYTYTARTTNPTTISATCYWGTTGTYNTRIGSFTYQQPYSWEAMYENVGDKNLVGFFLTPGLYYFGPLFYAIGFSMFGFMLYRRSKSFTPVLVLLILLGGVGGAFLKPIIPSIGFEWGWALVMLGVAGLFYKLVHGASSG